MQKINGKYNQAVVFSDELEDKAAEQIRRLCDQAFYEKSIIRVMPDVHAGAGCTIGTTMTISKKITPNLVGVDIGCGMEVALLKQDIIDLKKLDQAIHEKIPAGFLVRATPHEFLENTKIDKLRCRDFVNIDRARKSVGTLGGGNHFIELNKDENGKYYLVVHSGSRHLGKEIAEYYQKEAYSRLNGFSKLDIQALIANLKEQGCEKEIEKAIKKAKKQNLSEVSSDLAYVEGDLFEDYLHDMRITQEYAFWNRKAIVESIITEMNLEIDESFTTIHNYIDIDQMILRKGAVSARQGEKLIIPMNMRDGSFICIGKGNKDWNESAPHGAGRIMSRTAARKNLNLDEFQHSMKGIYSTTIGKATIDEAPMAYKPVESIMSQIGDTVDIVAQIRPVYNFKAMDG